MFDVLSMFHDVSVNCVSRFIDCFSYGSFTTNASCHIASWLQFSAACPTSFTAASRINGTAKPQSLSTAVIWISHTTDYDDHRAWASLETRTSSYSTSSNSNSLASSRDGSPSTFAAATSSASSMPLRPCLLRCGLKSWSIGSARCKPDS